MSLAAERAYFDGDHCQHVAAFHEEQRLRRAARKFRTMEAGNYRIAQFCADIMGGAR